MQALATPIVSILHQDRAFTFTLRSSEVGSAVYVSSSESVQNLTKTRPGTIFETGSRWQLVPTKLYRYEDRASYLKGLYPYLDPENVGVVTLPQIDAMGVFDRNTLLDYSLYSGNHIAELLLDTTERLKLQTPTFALVFFYESALWLIVLREGKLAICQTFRYQSESDAVFYIAALMKQYGIIRQHCPLYAGGMISRDSQLHRHLAIYFELLDLQNYLDKSSANAGERLLFAYQDALLYATPSLIS